MMEQVPHGTSQSPAGGPAARIQQQGEQLLRALYRMLKLVQLHERNNDALARPLEDLKGVLMRLHALDSSWTLRAYKDYLHLCDQRLKINMEIFPVYRTVLDELQRRNIGSIGVRGILDTTVLTEFLYAFMEVGQPSPESNPLEELKVKLSRAGVEGIDLGSTDEGMVTSESVTETDIRRRSIETFFKSIYLTRGLLTEADAMRTVHLRRARRLVGTLIDIMNVDESILFGLTNIKSFDDYTFNHSVNVCVLSIAIGRRLGLERRVLGDLSVAAIFHDIGKITVPPELINKTEALSEADWSRLHRHPVDSIKQMIKLKGISEPISSLIIAVYRHHTNFDRSGYPDLPESEEVPLFARIIRIADSYDAMTSKRVYRRGFVSNVEALEELWNLAGSHYDPALLKVFISAIGIFPVGTLVQLNSGEIAIVTKNSLEPEHLLRPRVRTLAVWEDRPASPCDIDLSRDRSKEILGYFKVREASTLIPSLLLAAD